jgi:ubiquinone/menaquinone biosynthesis C-methylase UbiE
MFGALTEDVLRRAGVSTGMHVLDLGCGVGDVSLLAARLVGPHGSGLGIDKAPSSIEIAQRRAAAEKIANARFETADLLSFDPAVRFDAVVGRFVLLYMPPCRCPAALWTVGASRRHSRPARDGHVGG